MATTIEALLYKLKHHCVFPMAKCGLHDPYCLAMLKIETFTFAVITFLEQPGTSHHSLVPVIQEMYDGLPSFHLYQQLKFGLWVKNGVVKHPLRRPQKQTQWLAVMDTITEVGVEMSAIPKIVLSAVSARKNGPTARCCLRICSSTRSTSTSSSQNTD
jgi:hypothetical protein